RALGAELAAARRIVCGYADHSRAADAVHSRAADTLPANPHELAQPFNPKPLPTCTHGGGPHVIGMWNLLGEFFDSMWQAPVTGWVFAAASDGETQLRFFPLH